MFLLVALHLDDPVARYQHKALTYLASNPYQMRSACTLYPAEFSGAGDYLRKSLGILSAIEEAKQILEQDRIRIGAMFKVEIWLWILRRPFALHLKTGGLMRKIYAVDCSMVRDWAIEDNVLGYS